MKKSIAQILLDEGYIKTFQLVDDGTQGVIHITLKYNANKEKVITGLRRVSKPGLRVYVGAEELPRVLRGLGIAIISTSKGVMQKIRCEDCGKTYDYEADAFCPNCGAFNQPLQDTAARTVRVQEETERSEKDSEGWQESLKESFRQRSAAGSGTRQSLKGFVNRGQKNKKPAAAAISAILFWIFLMYFLLSFFRVLR